jgi:hypothetical protein
MLSNGTGSFARLMWIASSQIWKISVLLVLTDLYLVVLDR